ncbi:MAG: HigA family addiction module antitoxin [Thermoanaerobaculales bacterium]
MARRGDRLIPARNIPPGAIIRKEIVARGWTQDDLARIMGRPVQVISEIISAKKQITPETALGLAAAFGTSAEMWLNMETMYRLLLARRRGADDAVRGRSRIYSLLPVKELVRRCWIEDSECLDELTARVEGFLGVASLDELGSVKIAARRTATREPDPRAVLAWTRRVEQLASAQQVAAFDPSRLKGGVRELLSLTQREDGPTHVAGILKSLGVHFILVPHLPKTYFDGAVFPIDGKPVLALTLRYDRLDSFWFTLMHEMAHLVLGHEGGRLEDLDDDAGSDSEEMEADALAAEWLVPEESLADFVAGVQPYFSRQAVWSFAHGIGRHPAIVLGRLQHEGHVSRAHLSSAIPRVRRRLELWVDVPAPAYPPPQAPSAAAVHDCDTPYDAAGVVLEWLRAEPGWHAPAEIKDALNLDRSLWNRTIRILVADRRVERMGEKRGTKYRFPVDGSE